MHLDKSLKGLRQTEARQSGLSALWRELREPAVGVLIHSFSLSISSSPPPPSLGGIKLCAYPAGACTSAAPPGLSGPFFIIFPKF